MEDQSQKRLRKRKPFRLLGKMDAVEISRFRNYLESPPLNSKADKKLLSFFDHCFRIRLWNRDIDKAGFEAETQLALRANAFDRLVSDLYQHLISFAAIREFSEKPLNQHVRAMRYFKGLGLEAEEIGKLATEGRRELANIPDNEVYFDGMLGLELEVAMQSQSRAQSPEERGLVGLHSYLDGYYFILKLRFLCATANEQGIFGATKGDQMNAVGVEWLRTMYDVMPSLAKIYYHAFHILNGWDDELHLELFRRQLTEWEAGTQSATQSDFVDLNGYLLNYYLKKMNAGDLTAIPDAHSFYQEGLEKGWLLEDGKLSPEHFKNILTSHCRMKLMAEARAFYEQYKSRLTDDQEGALLVYTDVVLAYYEQRYGEVIPKLVALTERTGAIRLDHFYGLSMRCLLLKAYYEYLGIVAGEEWATIDDKMRALLRAFGPYVERKELPRTLQIQFDNFREAMHRLYTISYDLQEDLRVPKLKVFLLDLKSSSNLPDKGWFVEKAMEGMG